MRLTIPLSFITPCSAIVIGLLVMMWPVLTKVQYERLPEIAREKKLWYQIGISLLLNWVIGGSSLILLNIDCEVGVYDLDRLL